MVRWQLATCVLGLALTALMAGLNLAGSQAEWLTYQRAYYRLTASRAGAQAGVAPRPAIQQIELAALNRVDRCPTCHMGVADPFIAGAPEPVALHSEILESHPPQTYGCTVCHGGEGRAVTLAEAHGSVPGQHGRLWPRVLQSAACYSCHGLETLPAADTGEVAEGIKLINIYQCLRCHQIDGVGGSIGPDLSAIASQRNWVELYAHLLNPAAVVPGSTMPNLGLSRGQATAITAYLLTRLDPAQRVSDASYLVRQSTVPNTPTLEAAPTELEPEVGSEAAWDTSLPPVRYDGEQLFAGLECQYCHRIGSRGGEAGPVLTRIGRVRSAEWLADLLSDPARVFPDGQMPVYDLNAGQIAALVDYLVSLR